MTINIKGKECMYANFGFYKLGRHGLRFPVLSFAVASSLSQPPASHLLDLQSVSWWFCLLACSLPCLLGETGSPYVSQTGLQLLKSYVFFWFNNVAVLVKNPR